MFGFIKQNTLPPKRVQISKKILVNTVIYICTNSTYAKAIVVISIKKEEKRDKIHCFQSAHFLSTCGLG